jgi:acyl-CoA dehydrogenase
MFISSSEDNAVGAIELALAATLTADPIETKIREATKSGRMSVKAREDRVATAQAAGIITAEEAAALRRAQRLVDKVIRVDDFPPDLGASEMRLAGAVVAHKVAA